MIGNGNVAIDVARMLVLSDEELRVTDVADHALEAFRASAVREVLIIGRRGPAQAAFTNPEVRSSASCSGADVHVDPAGASSTSSARKWLEDSATRPHRVNVETLTGYAGARRATGAGASITLRFLASPVAIHGDDRVEAIELERNVIAEDDGRLARARHRRDGDDPRRARLPLDRLPRRRRSPGCRSTTARGVDPATSAAASSATTASTPPGLYVAGWIKRGPSGVIGTNKQDGVQTAKACSRTTRPASCPGAGADDEALLELLAERCPDVVSFAGWQAIDEVERAAGEPQGRPRVKLVSREELNGAARGVARSGRAAPRGRRPAR